VRFARVEVVDALAILVAQALEVFRKGHGCVAPRRDGRDGHEAARVERIQRMVDLRGRHAGEARDVARFGRPHVEERRVGARGVGREPELAKLVDPRDVARRRARWPRSRGHGKPRNLACVNLPPAQ
jgi:hypothetical protein